MTADMHRLGDSAATSIVFGQFRLFPMQRLLTEAGKPVHLGSRAFDILLALLECAGELVAKEELMARVWPNTFVAPANIAVHISTLRRALGDGRRGNRYVVNIPGRGYCFVAAVSVEKDTPSQPVEEPAYEHDLRGNSARPLERAETARAVAQQLNQRRSLTIVGSEGVANTPIAFTLVEKLIIKPHESGGWLVGLAPCEDQ